jgi:hypothetical protein
MGGGGTEVVAMGLKKSAGRGGIANDFEAFKPRRLKREGVQLSV